MVSVSHRNIRRIIRGDQISLRLLKSDIEKSKENIFFINHRASGSTHAEWYLVKVDQDQFDPVSMKYYRV